MLDSGQIMSVAIPKLPTFGERLKWARELRGVAQGDLMETLQVTTRQTPGRLENNKYPPSLWQVEALAKRLDVDPVWLAFGRGMPFALPAVESYLRSDKAKHVPADVAAYLRDHSHRLFYDMDPSDAEIELALLLIARLLPNESQRRNGDGDR